jgi:phosphonopyruvate decarboxylase
MINPERYFNSLQASGINFFAGVPDSLLKEFCACVSEKSKPNMHHITANEGTAIGLGIGYYLGTGDVPMIYLQNSGLGNLINPILSLASNEVYAIPLVIIVGWRGQPGIKDEPQHIHQGSVMIESLAAMRLPYIILDKDENEALAQTRNMINLAKDRMSPVFIIVRKNSFEPFPVVRKPSVMTLSREDAIISVAKCIPNESLVVCTTGMSSRELFEFRIKNSQGHHRDFLTVGGMGHASLIALGLSKGQPSRQIYCFDGDGAALMHMGSLTTIGQSEETNLTHIIFNNGVHDSVGGQPTVGFGINFCDIASACGYKSVTKIKSIKSIASAIDLTVNNPGPHFIEVQVRPGNRSDIGRPTTSPQQNKNALMQYLGVGGF